jgi:hypothetical protein
VPEPVDWPALCVAYGNPKGEFRERWPNVTEFVNPEKRGYEPDWIDIEYYPKSGGIFASRTSTWTVGKLSRDDAYRYALFFLRRVGGLPPDAVLTWGHAGIIGGSNIPSRIAEWGFSWRPRASKHMLYGSNINVTVDELNGYPQVSTYRRLWRSVGARLNRSVFLHVLGGMHLPHGAVVVAAGICANDDLADDQNVAVPCKEYVSPAPHVQHFFVSSEDSRIIGFY